MQIDFTNLHAPFRPFVPVLTFRTFPIDCKQRDGNVAWIADRLRMGAWSNVFDPVESNKKCKK
jgi:hypothetical protein